MPPYQQNDQRNMSPHYDVIIIGTGAGGGSLLNRIAPSGKRILVLERGPFLPREKDNWSYHGSFKYYSSATRFIPGSAITSGATPKSMAPLCSGCVSAISKGSDIKTDFPPNGLSNTG